jgi:hypothetical protein
MSQSVEDVLSQSFQGYNVDAFRSLFEQQTEYNAESYSLNSTDMGFDSPVLNSSFVHFMFLGKYGQYIINEADWEFGMAGKEFLGLKLLEDMRKEASLIGSASTKQQIELQIDRITQKWLSLLDGLTEVEQADFKLFVFDNFEYLIRNHLNVLPDFQESKIKLRCNGNEAVFLFLSLCEAFWGVDNKEQKRIIAKLEDTFMFNNQTAKGQTKLKNFEKTQNKYRNGGLSNIDGVIQSLNQLLESGKTQFGNHH